MKRKITQIFVFGSQLFVYRGHRLHIYETDYHRSPRITNVAIEMGAKVIERRWDTEYKL